jgi:uncharacterized membrane protein
MLKVWLTMLAILATPLAAQDVPRLYDVTDVAAGDVLNIRATPSPSAPVIATLPANATGVEVTARTVTRRWGRVNTGEGVGWVSTRFLSPQGRAIDNYNLPVGLRCFGTEPFWSLTNGDGSLHYTDVGGADQNFAVTIAQDTGIPDDLRRMIRLDGGAVAYLSPAQCSDGMSDRLYALTLSFMPGLAAPLLSGCCSLSP